MSKSFVRSIKNVANGYSSVQILVRKATSNDSTGPTTYDMEEISSYTYQSQTDFLEIMDMLDRRLNDKGKNWRHVAKSLTVLDYLVRFGSEKCVMWAKDNLYIVKTLREFVHFDEGNNDQGAIIRVKAKELVSLLRDDDRLAHERSLAAKANGSRGDDRRRGRRNTQSRQEEPYDNDLERALELSRLTAEQEVNQRNRNQDQEDPDLQAALKLSLEEEEMRKLKNQQNDNLLDLDDGPSYYQQQQPQYYMATGYYQQPQQYGQQYDMFGNPIQNQMMTGYYQQQPSQPQFTGFNYQPQKQPQESLQPLQTGSNNPFAMGSSQAQPQSQTLNDLAQSQQQPQQPQFFTQPTSQSTQKLQSQNTSSSKFGDHSHPELNNLLAQGTGIDTFGNTGDARVAHHYTKGASFLTSSGTGIQQTDKALYAHTGNPFIPQQTAQPGQNPSSAPQAQRQQPVYTGYGFGNAAPSNSAPNQRTDGPSLIDI
ncbi:hypothetical protein PSN45_003352 [Yamadazyma tenuis]|uniref:ENTH-domain-containing protein n=1 Tax=Candida tenuis (strain ATCC 10573 / BCRC 21748 / CBS 615 / JCM 9827 / NBRC 10315 / NRRL Y-1498 / VKM Y-70) TaxID=590646 RepID=G3AYG4_CANTC|nr:ENTH-domain-containing protein [Yamadazyma tenuis ATCC 10573]XP_006684779.1 uncharacterized protein CANTEDRAFT_112719 [Yamadazyma tenuis ATCC 10573]EGV66204.1 ENTH-domain-containing protein [Yamadazyma tenuis ATCC 10573]EGV66205.1 hypothetical protein CANTEDRAFT_112719 [Yamadazyma tenuis ATCC 10573]WEJ95824.1 hypothetical protein PSN45_003352 [Yamadazyma tenuis]